MADRNLNRFIPPNLRQPLSELSGIGYQLLDNVIGFDDGYDTTGELLARSLREDPVGTGRSIATGAYEGAKQAVLNPRETLAALGDEFVSAFDLLSTPAPEDASREELGARLEALSLLSSVLPAGKALQTAEGAIDAAQLRQAQRFDESVRPLLPPPDVPPGSRMIVPTQGELDSMSPDMMAGAFDIPLVDQWGNIHGERLVTPMSDEAVERIRPRSLDSVTIVDDPSLPKDVYGEAENNEIRVRPGLPPDVRAATIRHEISHIDAEGSNLPRPEIGTNKPRAAYDKDMLLESLRLELQNNKNLTADERRAYKDIQAEIRGLTPFELYQRNPGEMLARLAEGDRTTIRRLSPMQLLNPYIVGDAPLSKRAGAALETGIFSNTSRLRDVVPEKYKGMFSRDFYTKAPMDLDQARVMGFNYNPVNNEPGFIPGGVNVAPGGARPPAIPGSSPYSAAPDGTLLDMPDDILERNANFNASDTQNFKDGGLIQTPPGTRRGTVLPATFPEGMSGGEALMSGQADLALPGMIVDPINAVSEALMTLDRLRRGEDLPKEQVESAGMTLAAVPMGPAAMARRSPDTLFANPPSGGRKVQGRFAEGSTLSEQATRNIRAPEAGAMTGATKRQVEDLASRKAAPGTGEGRRAETAEMSVLRVVRTPVETARTKVQGAAPQSGQSARYDPVTGEATASFQRKPGDVYRMAAEAVSGDPSNEWLEVPAGTLERLNMTVGNFTDPKSRVSPDKRTVYLASGPDTARFLQAWGSQAEFFGLPPAPTLKKPSVLPNRSIFGFPTVAKPGKSFEDLKQEARGATVKSQGPAPKSKFFD
jgi:hypothetical protein